MAITIKQKRCRCFRRSDWSQLATWPSAFVHYGITSSGRPGLCHLYVQYIYNIYIYSTYIYILYIVYIHIYLTVYNIYIYHIYIYLYSIYIWVSWRTTCQYLCLFSQSFIIPALRGVSVVCVCCWAATCGLHDAPVEACHLLPQSLPQEGTVAFRLCKV